MAVRVSGDFVGNDSVDEGEDFMEVIIVECFRGRCGGHLVGGSCDLNPVEKERVPMTRDPDRIGFKVEEKKCSMEGVGIRPVIEVLRVHCLKLECLGKWMKGVIL